MVAVEGLTPKASPFAKPNKRACMPPGISLRCGASTAEPMVHAKSGSYLNRQRGLAAVSCPLGNVHALGALSRVRRSTTPATAATTADTAAA
jgi:hypothetical protein